MPSGNPTSTGVPMGSDCAVSQPVHPFDRRAVGRISMNSIAALRITTGVIVFWFGALKFFSGRSPAEDLAVRTVRTLSRDAISPSNGRRAIAVLESLVGLGLLIGHPIRPTLLLFVLQLTGALSPLMLFPRRMFRRPWQPTLEGQYVAKDIVLVAVALVLGSTVRDR